MKFFVGDKEKEFFAQNGLLLFEDIFSHKEMDDLRLAAESEALTAHVKDLAIGPRGESMKKILFSQNLAQVAFLLSGRSPLRYGYDLFFRTSSLPEKLSSSLEPLKIGACIALDSQEGVFSSSTIPFIFRREDLPLTKGSVLFFSPKVTLSFEGPSSKDDATFFFLLFTGARAQYTFHPDDPYTHDLKRFGYVFGDTLRTATHPLLYR